MKRSGMKNVAGFFAVGLIALEVMYSRAHLVARAFVGTNGMNSMSNHRKRLKRHHDFVIFHEITDKHQNFFFTPIESSFLKVLYYLLGTVYKRNV
jgi:hypothetical protein